MSPRGVLLTVVLAAAALALGVYVSGTGAGRPAGTAPDTGPTAPEARSGGVVGQPRPAFALPDATGAVRDVAQWSGNVIVMNFWASWCAPCREEMPALIELQARYGSRGLSTIGIAADTPERATAFAEELGINYPSLFAERDVIELGKRYGNVLGVLPYTVVIDREGIIRYTHLGLIEPARLEEVLAGLL